jgi:hypothetical protein
MGNTSAAESLCSDVGIGSSKLPPPAPGENNTKAANITKATRVSCLVYSDFTFASSISKECALTEVDFLSESAHNLIYAFTISRFVKIMLILSPSARIFLENAVFFTANGAQLLENAVFLTANGAQHRL